MIIPVGLDEEEVRRTPGISYAIIAINILAFVLIWIEVSRGVNPFTSLGYIPAEPRLLNLFTCLFVHAGILHLLGNMLFFFITRPFIEDLYGRPIFLLHYLASGIAATLAHAKINPESDLPVVGASGAISGIMGAFLVRLGRRRIRFLWFPLPPLPWRKHFTMPAFVFLPLWFLSQLLMANVAQERGGVAVYAHLGGFLFGALAALLIAATGVEKRFIHPAIEAEVGYSADADFLRAIEQGDQEDWENARATLARLIARDPKNVDVRRYALEVAMKARDEAGIAAHGSRLLEMYLQLQEGNLARDLIHETSSSKMPARFLLHAADFVLKDGDARTAIDLYLRAADDHPTDPAALRALLQASELLRKAGDPAGARAALDRGLRHPGCVGDWKDTFVRKLAQLPSLSPRSGAAPGPHPSA